jgi:glycosyltransferase involved in cell wall biosynthesis
VSETLALSIVIPTQSRATILTSCLEALFAQQRLPAGAEIVVVDDGSTDDTGGAVERAQTGAPLPVRYFRQPARGPAAARNLGLRHARGAIVLFLGDDMIATPTLVAEHLRIHDAWPQPEVAVLGFITWAASLEVTPYMRWLETSGNQFDFESIRGQDEVDPARYLYTSNLSLKRAFLIDGDTWFDERFRHALLEDIELGRRLADRGLRLRFNPSAVVRHHHAVTLAGYARRIERTSEYLGLLESIRRPAQQDGPRAGAAPRRDYGAYVWFLLRVCGEVIRNWPWWWLARFFERRRVVPDVFARAHRHWAHRGLLRLEARRAMKKLGLA